MPRDNHPTVTQRLLKLEEAFIKLFSPSPSGRWWVSSANSRRIMIHCGDNTLHYLPHEAGVSNCFFITNQVKARRVFVEMWDCYLNDPRVTAEEWENAVEVGMAKMNEELILSVCDADAYK